MVHTIHFIGLPGDELGRLVAVATSEADEVRTAASLDEFLSVAIPGACDCAVVFSDIAAALIDAIRARGWSLPVIVLGHDDPFGLAVGLMRQGAAEYLALPVSKRHFRKALRKLSPPP